MRVQKPRLVVQTLLLTAALAGPAAAQRIDWHVRPVLYGDNTEFFTPYRVGETILGGQLSTWLAYHPGPRTEVRAGLFADRRWGSDNFTDSLKPVFAFRFRTEHFLGVFGTLENVERHGLIEPLMVTTRELTTPIEYGGQVIENRKRFHGELWINWQKLNVPGQREQFEVGSVFQYRPTNNVDVNLQHLWYHRGGQLFDPTPVTNNRAGMVGVTVHDTLGKLGRSYLTANGLWSSGHIDPAYPLGRPNTGHGAYLRAGITPMNFAEVYALHWIGKDYNGDDGDNNYSSTGFDETFYQSHRVYTEIGMIRRTPIEGGATFDAEFRFHNIDNLKSIAFFHSHWEISYRMIVRVPVDITLRK